MNLPRPDKLAGFAAARLIEERDREAFLAPAGGILVRPTGSDGTPALVTADQLREELLADILSLPPVDGASQSYIDLRFYVIEADDREGVAAYIRDVVRAGRKFADLKRWRTPRLTTRPPAQSAAERKAHQRAKERHAELLSTREWLLMFAGELIDKPRIPAADLRELVIAGVEGFVGDDHDDGTPWRVPSHRAFYAAADAVLGERTRSHGVSYYRLP